MVLVGVAVFGRAADVTGNPVVLARALSKIHRATNPEWRFRSLLCVHSESEDEGL